MEFSIHLQLKDNFQSEQNVTDCEKCNDCLNVQLIFHRERLKTESNNFVYSVSLLHLSHETSNRKTETDINSLLLSCQLHSNVNFAYISWQNKSKIVYDKKRIKTTDGCLKIMMSH